MESECLNVISEVKKGFSSTSKWYCIILDIDLFRDLYGVQLFSFTPRITKGLTHDISKSHGLQNITQV